MSKKLLLSLLALAGAFVILFISILRTAAVKYEFKNGFPLGVSCESDGKMQVNYYLAFPGNILPDHPLWYVKALRDKIWLVLTTNLTKKAELNLLFADKRLASSVALFNKGKYDQAYSTLTKSQKYLENACLLEEEARKQNYPTGSLAQTLIVASLKHREVIRGIAQNAPEDLKPKILETEKYAKTIFDNKIQVLKDNNLQVPINPYLGQ